MSKVVLLVLFTSFLYADEAMMALFESLKKQERESILNTFKQEKELRSHLRRKPSFHRKGRKGHSGFHKKKGKVESNVNESHTNHKLGGKK